MRPDDNCMITRSHEWFMEQALKEAEKALLKGESPIGAVIVHKGRIIARGHNEKEARKDSTLHAEMTTIRKASKSLDSWRLTDCDMYVTLEPCAMCAGAIIQARIARLHIGTPDPKAGAVGSVIDITTVGKFNHKVDVSYGLLEDRCSQILKDFFKYLRKGKAKTELETMSQKY